nr:Uncharacterised protein [Klebsiella pneumoniae]
MHGFPCIKAILCELIPPRTTSIPERGEETATAPRMRQYEQLQRRTVLKPSLSSTVNATAPQ